MLLIILSGFHPLVASEGGIALHCSSLCIACKISYALLYSEGTTPTIFLYAKILFLNDLKIVECFICCYIH